MTPRCAAQPELSPQSPIPSDPERVRDSLYIEVQRWRRRQGRRPWKLAATVLAGAAVVLMTGCLIDAVRVPTRSERDAKEASQPKRPKPWHPSFTSSPESLRAIDLERVHRELIPNWIIALQNSPNSIGRSQEEQSFKALDDEAGKDPNLRQLLSELRERATDNIAGQAGFIRELLKGWNQYLENNQQPWRLEYNILATARGGLLLTRSYRVLADQAVSVGDHPQRARWLSRVDALNVGEMFFGQENPEQNGVLVVSDRVAEFAVDKLWPLFDSGSASSRTAVDRAFAPHLMREAQGVLSAQEVQTLQQGAELRRQISQKLDEVQQRRGCGGYLVIDSIPWNGLRPSSLQRLSELAARNASRHCPRLTPQDARALGQTSETLRTLPGLTDALGHLSAWVARAVTVHEVRHAQDDAQAGKGERTPSCPSCPTSAGATDRAEISAYLAAAATPGVGYLSVYQTCGLDLSVPGSSAAALRFVLPQLAPEGCESALDENLYSRAKTLELSLFGRSDVITVPGSFPVALPLVAPSDPVPVPEASAFMADAPKPRAHRRRLSYLQSIIP